MSVSPDFVGQATPVEAARWFIVNGDPRGYDLPPDAVWTVGPPSPSGATIMAGDVLLGAVQLPDNTWAIAGGERCG